MWNWDRFLKTDGGVVTLLLAVAVIKWKKGHPSENSEFDDDGSIPRGNAGLVRGIGIWLRLFKAKKVSQAVGRFSPLL